MGPYTYYVFVIYVSCFVFCPYRPIFHLWLFPDKTVGKVRRRILGLTEKNESGKGTVFILNQTGFPYAFIDSKTCERYGILSVCRMKGKKRSCCHILS